MLLVSFCVPLSLTARVARLETACARRSHTRTQTTKRVRACTQPAPDEHSAATAAASRLPDALRDLTKPLRAEPSAAQRYAALIALGARLPRAPPRALAPHNRVSGCVSLVHVEVTVSNGIVKVHGAADSAVARGLVYLLVHGTQQLPVDKFLTLTARDIATAAGLSGVAASSRAAALTRVLSHAHAQVRGILDAVELHTERARWTDVGGFDTAVLLSGGVDSAVALRLAQQEGRRVRAFYLRIWLAEEEAHLSHCPWADDVASARAVCEQANVPFEQVALQEEYRARVVRYVVSEAKAGRTPNPDVMCNSRVKYGAFLEYVNAPAVVSGHYARVRRDGERASLMVSADEVKDQTYFLAALSQTQLRRAVYPLGGLRKPQVREMAREWELPNMDRPDSQGVCFLGKVRWEEFLRLHLGEKKGSLVEWETGGILGSHDGFWFYTLGQRRGIRLGNGPWYVVSKDVEENIVYVSRGYWGEQHGMERKWFEVGDTNWIGGMWPLDIGQEMLVRVKIRHGPYAHDAVLRRMGDEKAEVRLETRDKALAPGQFAVFYVGDECIGCGAITTRFERPAVATSWGRASSKSVELF